MVVILYYDMPYKDKEKRLAYNRIAHKKWYYKHHKVARRKIEDRRTAIKDWLWEYKCTLHCSRCPESHPATLDFHHSKGEKEQSICKLACNGASKNKILLEISKCEVLCSNCHRKEHCQR